MKAGMEREHGGDNKRSPKRRGEVKEKGAQLDPEPAQLSLKVTGIRDGSTFLNIVCSIFVLLKIIKN